MDDSEPTHVLFHGIDFSFLKSAEPAPVQSGQSTSFFANHLEATPPSPSPQSKADDVIVRKNIKNI